jgi:Transposase DDE domain/Transposase domain (DUF772)
MMVALLLYSYAIGVRSSRRIERGTYEDLAFRMLTADQHPDHSRISGFRKTHLAALELLFLEVLKLCRKAGMVKLGLVALDGSKFRANASKHKAMSYKRMQEDEVKLAEKIRTILQEAEAMDQEEEARLGSGRDDLPEDLRRSEGRLERIRKLREDLEAEARAQQEEGSEQDDDEAEKEQSSASTKRSSDDAGGRQDAPSPADVAPKEAPPVLPSHRIPTGKDGKPTDKAQRNFTDAESRIMKSSSEGFLQGYNAQIAVDDEFQVILAQAVTNQSPDVEHFSPMLAQVAANCGEAPQQAVADNGYHSEANIAWAQRHGTNPYLATGRQKHGERPAPPPDLPPEALTPKERMKRKLSTREGAAIYARRKCIVEPVFGQIKDARGIRGFLLRGLEKVRGEFSLIATTHNLLKLFRRIGRAGLPGLLGGPTTHQR